MKSLQGLSKRINMNKFKNVLREKFISYDCYISKWEITGMEDLINEYFHFLYY